MILLWAAPAPALDSVLEVVSNEPGGIELLLKWNETSFPGSGEGLRLELSQCGFSGEPGDPMMPRFHRLVAIPPGMRAELDFQVIASRVVEGLPLPYPTPHRINGLEEDPLYREDFIRNEVAFALSRSMGARLEEPRRLRDLRIASLVVEPMSWDPASGLRLATEMRVSVRFLPDPTNSDRNMHGVLRGDRVWDSLYGAALLNSEWVEDWRRRVPAKSLFAERDRQTESLFTLKTNDSGLFGVTGSELIAAGVPAGTEFSEIALFERRFQWDEFEQPDYQEIPVARIFRDVNGDGNLDADDKLVFLGRRLKDQPDSLDFAEWYGREGSVFLALNSDLALDMQPRAAWQEDGSWTVPSSFDRRFTDWGEVYTFSLPPHSYYADPPLDYWLENLHFFNHWNVQSLNLRIPSPAYLEGSEAHLTVKNSGYNRADPLRTFDMIFTNDDGTETVLEQMFSQYNYEGLYETDLDPGVLADGEGNLLVDRVDSSLFRTMVKWWDLEYLSRYAVWNDSLLFTNGSDLGALEFQVEGLTRGYENWILVKSSADTPVLYELGPENESGGAGDYGLQFRDQVNEDGTWWLADENMLLSPRIESSAPVSVLQDPGPYDLLVISHEDFLAPVEDRYVPYREAQGYRVKVLGTQEVWDIFYGGAREAIGLRNAIRFAYQQWGIEAALLVGDGSKDSRVIGEFGREDFMPAHFIHESVEGVNEVVALDEWVASFGYNQWPSVMFGRIPASTVDDMETYMDKLECFEATESYENCEAGGDWRSKGLMIADDDWSYSGLGEPSVPVYSERYFRIGQEEALDRIAGSVVNDSEWGFPDGFVGVPFFEEVITVPWYEEHSPANSSEIIEDLRPELWPVFVDTLSQGYLFAMIQSHANRNLLTHEGLFDSSSNSDHGDHDYVENVGMPFIWAVLGCHGNAFCHDAEGSKKDCMGEKFLFLDQNRGSIASYASDGYEFLYPNNNLTNDIMEMLFWTPQEDPGMPVFPEWVLGSVLTSAELRYGGYQSSFRYNLLGDPLTRLDGGPPRIRFWLDEEEMDADDVLTVDSADDTVQVRAVITDEAYVTGLGFYDPAGGAFPFESRALTDSVAAEQEGRARAWEITAEVPYDFDIEALVVEATDLSGRRSTFELPNAKSVDFFVDEDVVLRDGQFVRSEGQLNIRIKVPHVGVPPGSFKLYVDGEATGFIGMGQGLAGTAFEDSLEYRIDYPYEWEAGDHQVEVLYQGLPYGEITLGVDSQVRLLSGLVYPNPFRDMALFRYSLTGEAVEGRLKIYTLSGRLIRDIEMAELSEGNDHWLEWDGLDQDGDKIANGTYLFRMVIKDVTGEELVWQDRVVRMR